MPDRKSSGTSDYVVGYRRPPKATQFAAGKSGNPKGRPKGSRSVGAVLKDILQQKIAVTENGKTRRIPALEVMLRRLANDAHAQRSPCHKAFVSADRSIFGLARGLQREERHRDGGDPAQQRTGNTRAKAGIGGRGGIATLTSALQEALLPRRQYMRSQPAAEDGAARGSRRLG
jgi:Family of unknown function (DUF5681)